MKGIILFIVGNILGFLFGVATYWFPLKQISSECFIIWRLVKKRFNRRNITKVLDAHPEVTKHTVPDGYKHQPVDSPIIRQEITSHFESWIDNRTGHEFPVDVNRSSKHSQVIFSSSMTCATDLNSTKFRETAGVLRKDGSVLPIHFLSHDDESRHLAKLEQERQSLKVNYKASLIKRE